MVCKVKEGPFTWEGQKDEEGHRTYPVTFLVESGTTDGPALVMQTPGLYLPGAIYDVDGDYDEWAYCLPTMQVQYHDKDKEGGPHTRWKVTQTFTTRPPQYNRCQDTPISDPLMEPQKVSGSFVKSTREATQDRFGNMIESSSHQRIAHEFQSNFPTVHIEQNVASLGLSTFAGMVDTVNSATLWGLPARHVLLANVAWERKILGTCEYYYTRIFDFEVDYKTKDHEGNTIGFDIEIEDVSDLVYKGQWGTKGTAQENTWMITGNYNVVGTDPDDPDRPDASTLAQLLIPTNFLRYIGKDGNLSRVQLNGYGLPANTAWHSSNDSGTSGDVARSILQYYPQSNFLTLGIPTSF